MHFPTGITLNMKWVLHHLATRRITGGIVLYFEDYGGQLAVFNTFGHLGNFGFTAHSSIRILIWSPWPHIGCQKCHRAFRVFVQQGARDQNWITIFFLLVKFYWWTFVNTDLGTTITILLTMTMMVAILVIIMIVIIIILIIVVMLIILIIPPVRHKIPTEMKKLN